MKYNWKLVHYSWTKQLHVNVVSEEGEIKRLWYGREFSNTDLRFLEFLLSELTYVPDWISPHKILKVQHKLGNAVWNKLGER